MLVLPEIGARPDSAGAITSPLPLSRPENLAYWRALARIGLDRIDLYCRRLSRPANPHRTRHRRHRSSRGQQELALFNSPTPPPVSGRAATPRADQGHEACHALRRRQLRGADRVCSRVHRIAGSDGNLSAIDLHRRHLGRSPSQLHDHLRSRARLPRRRHHAPCRIELRQYFDLRLRMLVRERRELQR